MRAIDIDLLPRRDRRRWWVVAAMAGAILVPLQVIRITRVGAELRASEVRRAEAAASAALAQERSAAARAMQEREVPYAQDAASIVRMASFDTPAVLAGVESARVEGVRLNLIEVHADEGRVNVELEFRDTPLLLTYVDAINAGMPVESRWKLLRAQAANGVSPGIAMLTRERQPQ